MKERLDILLVNRGLADTRSRARAMIMEGLVIVDGEREDKPGSTFPDTADITIKGKQLKYVSRGGLKLEKAVDVFQLDLKGKCCIDVGSSTGGFTDCMLQNGAVKVYAIDVGRGQLAWSLRNDDRVVCMEKTNIRYLEPQMIPEKAGFVSIDVSFISLSKVLPVVRELIDEDGRCVALIKPQFEAGRDKVGKKGVVRDKDVHQQVIENVIEFANGAGFKVIGIDFSPIKGPEGNIEYLVLMKPADVGKKEMLDNSNESITKVRQVVDTAHDVLDR